MGGTCSSRKPRSKSHIAERTEPKLPEGCTKVEEVSLLETTERAYLVWEVPGWPQLQGLHISEGPVAYHKLFRLGPGGKKLPFKAIRLRRIHNLEEPLDQLNDGKPESLPVITEVCYFRWQ